MRPLTCGFIVAITFSLVACGGGGSGGGGSSNPPPPPAPAGTGSISGTVQKAGGGVQASVHVRAISLSDPTMQVGHFTDPSGNYRINGLPDGDYQVVVENIDGRSGVTRSRISVSLLEATPAFPDEFYSGVNETSTDTPSLAQTVPVVARQTTTAVDFVLNDSGTLYNDTVTGVASPVPISVGDSVNGILGEASDLVDDSGLGYFIDAFVLSGVAGQTIQVDLSSIEFDVVLIMLNPDGNVRVDDDSGGGTDATLTVTLTQTGPYIILVSSFETGATGNYNLALTVQPLSVPALSFGTPVAGSLQIGDDLIEGFFVDAYQFTANSGTPISLNLSSNDFDAYLFLITPSGVSEVNDDASILTTDSLITGVLLESGTHVVAVSSFSPGETGAYTLVLASP